MAPGQDGGYLVPDETEAEIGKRLSRAFADPLDRFGAAGVFRGAEEAVLDHRTGGRLGRRNRGAAADRHQHAGRAAVSDDGALRHAGGDGLAARGHGRRPRPVDFERGRGGVRRAGGQCLRAGQRHQQAQGVPRLHQGGGGELGLGRDRLHHHRRFRRAAGEQPLRRADRHGVRAEGRLPAERQLGDEPQDAGRDPQAEGRRRQLSLAAAGRSRPAGHADGLSAGRGGRHAGRRRQHDADRLRRLFARLSRGRPHRGQGAARSVHRKTLRAVLHDQARRRRGAGL